jgi:hypothetical protein
MRCTAPRTVIIERLASGFTVTVRGDADHSPGMRDDPNRTFAFTNDNDLIAALPNLIRHGRVSE